MDSISEVLLIKLLWDANIGLRHVAFLWSNTAKYTKQTWKRSNEIQLNLIVQLVQQKLKQRAEKKNPSQEETWSRTGL